MIKSTFIGGLVLGLFATCATALAQEPVPEVAPDPSAAAPAPGAYARAGAERGNWAAGSDRARSADRLWLPGGT